MKKWLLQTIKRWLEPKPDPHAELAERCAKLEARLEEIAQHFVTQYDPATHLPVKTLADKYADEDGKPRPRTLPRSRQWNQQKRLLEARDAALPKMKVTN